MEIILKKDIDFLGYKNDLVTVKDGYGRNYLIPKGFAVLATQGIKKSHLEMLKQRAFKEEKDIKQAQENGDAIKSLDIKVLAKVAEGSTKLFGSINSQNLAEILEKEGYKIDKKYITIAGKTIKSLGKNIAKIRLHREVIIEINFEVLASENKKKKSANKSIIKEKDNIESTEKVNKEVSSPNTQTSEQEVKKDKKKSIDEVLAETNQGDKPKE